MTHPLFTDEGPEYYAAAYKHNAPFATPGPYNTALTPAEEQQFEAWVKTNKVPFDPTAAISDYDMRGFWKGGGSQNWKQGSHFPDTYKTPYDTSFSAESKYATANNPFVWQGDNLIDKRDGSVVFGDPVPDGSTAHAKPASSTGGGSQSGYGTRWHLEAVGPNGQSRVVQARMITTQSGETHWDAELNPGESLNVISHGGGMSVS